jgi:hypothetical protein
MEGERHKFFPEFYCLELQSLCAVHLHVEVTVHTARVSVWIVDLVTLALRQSALWMHSFILSEVGELIRRCAGDGLSKLCPCMLLCYATANIQSISITD